MQQIYYNAIEPGSFGGVSSLAKYTNTKVRNTRKWLSGEDAYTLHKPIRRKFKRRKTFVTGIDQLWQLDLVDMTSTSNYNDGYKFLLTCVDCFSRYAYVKPLRNKSASEVRNVFESILIEELRRPAYVQTDKGREFVNALFQQLLKENEINFYTSENNDIKCALVERFNRTLKSRMWRYFTFANTRRYLDVLPQLVRSYNDTVHRSIGIAPSLVTPKNESMIFQRLYKPPKKKKRRKDELEVGDKVRISETKKIFSKGYTPHWSIEIFYINGKINTNPVTYTIKDYLGEEVKGRFYSQELQKVSNIEEELYTIEKVLKTRKRNGKTQYLIRWLGYSPKFDSWVDNITVR